MYGTHTHYDRLYLRLIIIIIKLLFIMFCTQCAQNGYEYDTADDENIWFNFSFVFGAFPGSRRNDKSEVNGVGGFGRWYIGTI